MHLKTTTVIDRLQAIIPLHLQNVVHVADVLGQSALCCAASSFTTATDYKLHQVLAGEYQVHVGSANPNCLRVTDNWVIKDTSRKHVDEASSGCVLVFRIPMQADCISRIFA